MTSSPARLGVVAGAVLILACLAPPAAAPAPPPVDVTSAASIGRAQAAPSNAGQPLLIVLDLSSSMNEDDGTGTIKLAGAKASLDDLVRQQPAGAQIGLWTFPGTGSDSCSPGGFVAGLEVGPVQDPSALSATIRSLSAYGDTPTGPALATAVEALEKQGLTAATVLLVSDGESNCSGPPPCDVARSIVDQGFDVTVQAVGFRTSTAGRAELQCIADATEGEYYDIDDSGKLEQKLAELTVPQLELDVEATATSAPSSPATIRALIKNLSATDSTDVVVTASFTDAGSRTLFPGVVPPRFRVGNVPAGQQVERTWTVSPGAGGQGGIASYRVTAWADNAPATTVEGKIQVSGQDLGLADAGPMLTAVEDSGGVLAILGDSFSSGEGSGDYVPGTDSRPNTCHQSLRTYGAPLYDDDRVRLLACSGAVTANITGPQWDKGIYRSQIDQLRDGPAPEAVLMTIGGNDIKFAAIIEKCVKFGDCSEDEKFTAQTWRDIDGDDVTAGVGEQLSRTYVNVWRAANDPRLVDQREGRYAPLVVLGYPRVLPEATGGSCSGFTTSEIEFGNEVVDRLDSQISTAVARAVAVGAEVYYVPQTRTAVPPGNSACNQVPFINSIDLLKGVSESIDTWLATDDGKQELLHPNTRGYQAITNALVGWSRAVRPLTGRSTDVRPPSTISNSAPTVSIDLEPGAAPAEVSIRVGEGAEVTVRGFRPGDVVTITVNSTPRALASLTADANGTAKGVVFIPLDLPPGEHVLRSTGTDVDGGVLTVDQPLDVGRELPWWWWPVAAVGAAAALGAGTTALMWRRRSRAGTGAAKSAARGGGKT